MPRFDIEFANNANAAIGIVAAGETTRLAGGRIGHQQWSLLRIEALYELAYLRVFAEWESQQEAVFLRSLCGYASRAGGQETLVPMPALSGRYHPNIAAAERAMLGGGPFALWHDPDRVIKRCQRFIRSGAPSCPAVQENVISSNYSRLDELGAIRHRIVHTHQKDAKNNFDSATLTLIGRTYPASRPGKFLRDLDASAPRRRWLDVLVSELVNLLGQMV